MERATGHTGPPAVTTYKSPQSSPIDKSEAVTTEIGMTALQIVATQQKSKPGVSMLEEWRSGPDVDAVHAATEGVLKAFKEAQDTFPPPSLHLSSSRPPSINTWKRQGLGLSLSSPLYQFVPITIAVDPKLQDLPPPLLQNLPPLDRSTIPFLHPRPTMSKSARKRAPES